MKPNVLTSMRLRNLFRPLATYSNETVLKSTDVDGCAIGKGGETAVDSLKN